MSFILFSLCSLPSFYYLKKINDHVVYADIYKGTDMTVINLDKKERVGDDFSSFPLDKKTVSALEFNSVEKVVAPFIPFIRHVFLLILHETSIINKLHIIFNKKIKCNHCNLVHAYWSFHGEGINKNICPNCEKETDLSIILGNDKDYPFFVKKSKKEIKEMLLKRKETFGITEGIKKESVREEQIRLKKEHSSKNEFLDI